MGCHSRWENRPNLGSPQAQSPPTPVPLGLEPYTTHEIDVSPDKRWLATGKASGPFKYSYDVLIFDLSPERPAVKVHHLGRGGGSIDGVAFGPDGRWLIAAVQGGPAKLWDLRSNDPAQTMELGGAVEIRRAEAKEYYYHEPVTSPDRRWAVGTRGELWDLSAQDLSAKRSKLQEYEGCPPNDYRYSWYFSPDSRRLVVCDPSRNRTRLWLLDVPSPTLPPIEIRGREGNSVGKVILSDDGNWMLVHTLVTGTTALDQVPDSGI